jgi:hypothetical protein
MVVGEEVVREGKFTGGKRFPSAGRAVNRFCLPKLKKV